MKKIIYRLFQNGNVDIVNRDNVSTSVGLVVQFNGAATGDQVSFTMYGDKEYNLVRTLDENLSCTIPQNLLIGNIRVELTSNGRTYDCESMICYTQENGDVLVSPDDFDYRTKFSEILSVMDETNTKIAELVAKIHELETTIDTWSKGYDVE